MGPCSSSSKNKQASPMLDKKTNQIPSSQANPLDNQQPNNKPEKNPRVSHPKVSSPNDIKIPSNKANKQSDESIEEMEENTKKHEKKHKGEKLMLE